MRLTEERLDELTKTALNEILENPTVDDQIRRNPVIMKELSAAVARSLTREDKGS